jgi:hypothetical protein
MIHPSTFGILLISLLTSPSLAAEASIEQPVTFPGAAGATLAGTLQLPPGDGPFPALLLVAGSGPTDRNGNQPPFLITDLLKQFAKGLADKGIASLRFDKRGMYANSAQLPKDPSKLSEFFTWENGIGDVVAAYHFLRWHARIDPARVGILGHSQGSLIALDIARTLKAEGNPPAVLILVSGAGRPMDVILGEQIKAGMARNDTPPQEAEKALTEYARIVRTIRESGKVPPDMQPAFAGLFPFYIGKLWQGEIALDPSKLAAEYSGPVLVLAGSADIQISSERDAKALDAALAARKGDVHRLTIIPQASHNMKILADAKDPGFAGPVAPAAMDQLKQWAAEELRKK